MNNLWEATAEPSPECEPLAGSLSADVVVIGAGFTGCAAALRLAQASTDVCLIEAEDIGYATPLGVRQLLGDDDTGVIYGRLHPDPVPPNWYRDPEVLAQVTPYQVHFKAGHFNSQVWVTRFADGMPVPGARYRPVKPGAAPTIAAAAISGTSVSGTMAQITPSEASTGMTIRVGGGRRRRVASLATTTATIVAAAGISGAGRCR